MRCFGGTPGHCSSQHWPAPALHMLSFENFVKSMPPSLSELKVTPSFCFAFKITDDVAASKIYSIRSQGPNYHGCYGCFITRNFLIFYFCQAGVCKSNNIFLGFILKCTELIVIMKALIKELCRLGWAPWNPSCLEFKFDTRLSYSHKHKIGRIEKKNIASWLC